MIRIMGAANSVHQKVSEYLQNEIARKGLAYVSSSYASKELSLKSKQFGAAMRALRVATEINDPNLKFAVQKYGNKWLVRKK